MEIHNSSVSNLWLSVPTVLASASWLTNFAVYKGIVGDDRLDDRVERRDIRIGFGKSSD